MIGFIKRRYKDIAVIAILLGSLAMTFFRYRTALIRSFTSIKDFIVSIAYYFCQIFDIEIPVTPLTSTTHRSELRCADCNGLLETRASEDCYFVIDGVSCVCGNYILENDPV